MSTYVQHGISGLWRKRGRARHIVGATLVGVLAVSGTPARGQPCVVDTPSSCHDQGSGIMYSDRDFGVYVADDFEAVGSPITTVCWWGYYGDIFFSNSNCGPGPGDAFRVRFFSDAPGFPDTLISSQVVSPTKQQIGTDGDLDLYEYSANLGNSIAVSPGTKYWIEITNNTTLPPTNCNWIWKKSSDGNAYRVLSFGEVYGPEDVLNTFGYADAAFCLDADIAADDGGPVLGACCTSAGCPSTCNNNVSRGSCNGVWHAGQTCAATNCSPPSNDSCAAAQPLIALSTPFHNTCASLDGPSPVPTDFGDAPLDRDIWYMFTAAANHPGVAFSACDVGFDVVLAIYSSGTDTCSCPVDNTTLIGANDEGCTGRAMGAGGTMTIPVTAGTCYLVRLGGFPGGDEGLGRIEVSQLGAPPPTLYVNAAATGLNNGLSWTNAFNRLQDALAVAIFGQEIWVAKGTYKPATCPNPPCSYNSSSPERSATFQLESGVAIYGGFFGGESTRDARDPANNETILSGDLNGDDGPGPFEDYAENSYHVANGTNTDATALLDGFTVTGGNANSTFPNINNGGLVLHNGHATIRRCVFRGNSANQTAGAMGTFGSNSLIIDCVFSGNRADFGGAVSFQQGAPSIINCLFVGNSADVNAGGADNFDGASPTYVNCVFSGNTAGWGGGINLVGTNNAKLINCTYAHNFAVNVGGGVRNWDTSTTVIENCILWGNGAGFAGAQIQEDNAPATVNYSIVQGGWGGLGGNNLSSDPLFTDANGADNVFGTEDDDLRLQAGSPAIDAADTTALPVDTYDLDDDGITTERISLDWGDSPRILDDPSTNPGTGVDMGAYEYFTDCDGGGVPDACDLDCGAPDGPCDIPGCGDALDCNGNGVPDSCDIADCSGNPACDDCNLNGKPDICDVPPSTGCPSGSCVSGCSGDVNMDCVPDECVAPATSGGWENTDWGMGDGIYPGGPGAPPDLSVTIPGGTTTDLDVTVQVTSVTVDEGATLNVSGGDLLIEGDLPQTAGITPPPKLVLSIDGAVALSNGFDVTVSGDSIAINNGGLYHAAAVTDSALTAVDIAVYAGGELALEHSMTMTSSGTVILDGGEATLPVPCLPLAVAGDAPFGITQPPKLRLAHNVDAFFMSAFSMVGAVEVLVDSTQAMELGGDFDNRSVVPHRFDWTAGKLALNGALPQTFEVAGINLGQTSQGFLTDEDALFDTCQHTNYSMGTVEVASTANVTFANEFANTVSTGCGEAMYVHYLTFQSGATVTIDNCKVYYDTLTDNGVTPTVIGCGELLSTTRPMTPIPPPGSINKNRGLVLSIPGSNTAGPGALTALRVALAELQNPVPPNLPANPPPDFSAYEFASTCTDPAGCVRWIGEPKVFLESQDTPSAGNFMAARLQCTPLYRDWTTAGFFYVVGAEITPSSKYDVHQFAQTCTGRESSCTALSAPLPINTARSGDVEAPFNPPSTSVQPNAIDIAQVVTKVKNLAGALPKAIAQLQPNVPELNADVNALDIVAVVDAVKQKAYGFGGPCPCPSTVTCGSTACSTVTPCVSAFGAGATCVKTCTGGDNAGYPCINDTHGHCPGGTCGAGFCRDRCGRCTPP